MEQRTDEWFAARCGKVTASRLADVMAKTKSGYSDEQHEAAEAFLRDAMVRVARREVAISIWKNKNSYDEVA